MNLKSTIKYNIWSASKPLMIFYGIYLLTSTFFAVVSIIGEDVYLFGVNSASSIFMFVIGIALFKTSFEFGLANSVSRKNSFLSFTGVIVIMSCVMSIIDMLISVLQSLLAPLTPFYAQLYAGRYITVGDNMGGSQIQDLLSDIIRSPNFLIESVLWTVGCLICIGMIGYFIATLYYRMGKTLKIAVSFGVPMLLFLIAPIDQLLFDGKFTNTFVDFLQKIFGFSTGVPNPYIGMVTFAVLIIAIGGLCYLLVRRATVKTQ